MSVSRKIRGFIGVGLSFVSAICVSHVSYAVTKVWKSDNQWIVDKNGLVNCCSVKYELDGESLVISGRGAIMRDSIENNLTEGEMLNISEIRISRGITVIGKGAFKKFYRLIKVYIPDSVEVIGGFAFFRCYHLKNITIPKSVTVLGDAAFLCCGSLEKVNIPNSVNRIGNCCFCDCTNLREVKFENMARDGGKYYENSCSEIMIGRAAFESCLNLKVVDTGNRTAHFAYSAFKKCDSNFRPLEGRNVRGCFYYSGIFDELIAHNFLVDKSVYWGR